MENLKDLASIILGVFVVGIGVSLLFFWHIPWYAFVIPLVLFGVGLLFLSVGFSDGEI
jgi:hypothetical protein